jgi:hypothetical protein
MRNYPISRAFAAATDEDDGTRPPSTKASPSGPTGPLHDRFSDASEDGDNKLKSSREGAPRNSTHLEDMAVHDEHDVTLQHKSDKGAALVSQSCL